MAIKDSFVSVVAPLHNDADIIEAFINETMRILVGNYADYELVLVDDGSSDATVERANALLREHRCIRIIRLSRNFGREAAIAAGLDSVIGDYVVVMLPCTDPPGLISEIVHKARTSGRILYGIAQDRGREPLLPRVGSLLFYWYVNSVLKLNMTRDSTFFRVLTRQAVNAITRVGDKHRYLRFLTTHVGFGSEGFAYREIQRSERCGKRDFRDAINTAIAIVVANSLHPLRFVSALAIAASLLNVFYSLYVIAIFFLKDEVAEGWTTTSLQSAGMFFLLFVILSVLSEYIGHLLVETRDRPLYHVHDEITSSVLIADEEKRNVVEDSPVANRASPHTGAALGLTRND